MNITQHIPQIWSEAHRAQLIDLVEFDAKTAPRRALQISPMPAPGSNMRMKALHAGLERYREQMAYVAQLRAAPVLA